MSKTFVGARAQNMDIGAEITAITRVNLVVDSERMYTSGDDTGRTMEVECPWGSQEMANDILAKVSGVQYKPFSAERALLDPAFEIGDAVTIGGVYSQIADADCTYNGASLFTIKAPDLDEIYDEYPAQQTQHSSIKRKLAYTRSLISKKTDDVLILVQGEDSKGGLTGAVASLGVKLNLISARVSDTEGSVEAALTTLDGFTVTTTNENGTKTVKLKDGIVTADAVATNAITFSKLDVTTQNNITIASQNAAYAAEQVATVTYVYGGKTYINEEMLMTSKVIASKLMGGSVSLLTAAKNTAGTMTITGASSADFAVELNSGGALRLVASNGDAHITGSSRAFLTLGTSKKGTAICQLGGGALVISAASYGSSPPSNPVEGQVYFKVVS